MIESGTIPIMSDKTHDLLDFARVVRFGKIINVRVSVPLNDSTLSYMFTQHEITSDSLFAKSNWNLYGSITYVSSSRFTVEYNFREIE